MEQHLKEFLDRVRETIGRKHYFFRTEKVGRSKASLQIALLLVRFEAGDTLRANACGMDGAPR
jgi:hypothetical protein